MKRKARLAKGVYGISSLLSFLPPVVEDLEADSEIDDSSPALGSGFISLFFTRAVDRNYE